MQRNVLLIIIGAVIIVGGLIWWAISGQPKTSTSTNTGTHLSDQPHDTPETSAAVAGDQVTIEGFVFKPAKLTVKKGTKVTWTNQDSVKHSVIGDSASVAGGLSQDAPLLGKGEKYEFTFSSVGTFAYHCGPHPDMTGTVEVTE